VKIFEREIPVFMEAQFFVPIRTKFDYAHVLLNSISFMLTDPDISDLECNKKIRLVIDKMNRIFLYDKDSYFSISFPFNINIEGDKIIDIANYAGQSVTNEAVAYAIGILKNSKFILNPSSSDHCFEIDEVEREGLYLLETIFLLEPAYLRYDVDKERENGRLHPLMHLDLNYTNNSRYKLGLNSKLTIDDFVDIVNINTDCYYIEK
jgi:hypothetical protein